MVVSYYTLNTGYVDEVKHLVRSMNVFNVPYFVKPIKNRGSWQLNTMFKAEFCKAMLLKFKRKHIVFVDADAVFKQYPKIFDLMDHDIGVCYRDHAKFSRQKNRTHKELLSGTIYFANRPHVIAFIDLWIAYNRSNPGTWEQRNLERALKITQEQADLKTYLKVFLLPPTYCQIFDLMKAAGQPVIQQNQASRRLKHEIGGVKSNTFLSL